MWKRHLTHPILLLTFYHLDVSPGLGQVGIPQLGRAELSWPKTFLHFNFRKLREHLVWVYVFQGSRLSCRFRVCCCGLGVDSLTHVVIRSFSRATIGGYCSPGGASYGLSYLHRSFFCSPFWVPCLRW